MDVLWQEDGCISAGGQCISAALRECSRRNIKELFDHSTSCPSCGVNSMSSRRSDGSRAKLRAYFLANLDRVMDSDELRKASGNASEWARRVRELRTEEGYQILTHNDRSDLKPGQYLLLDPKPVPAFERDISKETRAYV